MNNAVIEQIQESAKALKLDVYTAELASFAEEKEYSMHDLEVISDLFAYLQQKKYDTMVSTLLKLSRLPVKAPKTFDNFDFSQLHGKHRDSLKNLRSLAVLYSRRNLAFIGPQGVGKTHLAMAFGRECCLQGYKTYFLKASELNQRLNDARKNGREGNVVNGLVKPSCLIIDEIGRCVFDKENTRLFFDVVDRRYNKEGPSTMIFTSNKTPDEWGEFFSEDDTLLCSLDRIFDDAVVYMIKGASYRGRKCETYGLDAGEVTHTDIKTV
ncbi:MAG: ATP-binding protein [Bilifractor sp.]